MKEIGARTRRTKTETFYDRIADVHNVALKINGYRSSVAKFFRQLDLDLDENSMVLDAGSGTGIVTLGFLDSGLKFGTTIAYDLSRKSLKVAAEEIRKDKRNGRAKVTAIQGNILALPFADESFDLVITCGVLEYVPLEQGLKELSRVLSKSGRLVLIPVKPSLVGSVLEFFYKFKIHPIENVRKTSQKYFKIVGDHSFPLNEPISWSKTVFLLEKK
ncbi:hypothetical protein BH24ACI3_BH24ACI3_01790 [soil metagenome]